MGSKVRRRLLLASSFLLPRSFLVAEIDPFSLQLSFHLLSQLPDADKKIILAALKESADWIEENQSSASAEEFEEKLAEVQSIVSPITSKLYSGGAGEDGEAPFS